MMTGDPQDPKAALVDALLLVPVMQDPDGRALIVRELAERGYQLDARRYARDRHEVWAIVSACQRQAGALTSLAEILRGVEGDSLAISKTLVLVSSLRTELTGRISLSASPAAGHADEALTSRPAVAAAQTDLHAGVPAGSVSSVTTYEPVRVPAEHADGTVPVIVHSGPIEQVTDVDILVSSENTYFEMSQSFKASTSARLRRTAAIRSTSGAILWDLEADGLHAWLRQNQCAGLRVNPGTIATTDPGALSQHGIKRLYHAAITEPVPGTTDYYVNPETITEAVRNAFATARSERAEPGLSLTLTSICFPLLGSGRGGLDPQTSLRKIWHAITEEARHDPTWTIHFASWKHSEAEMIYQTLIQGWSSP
jgi:O-acetyl-ADP-ribose deacetylase (regulator of RNase III)